MIYEKLFMSTLQKGSEYGANITGTKKTKCHQNFFKHIKTAK